jgi:hypothetical protein
MFVPVATFFTQHDSERQDPSRTLVAALIAEIALSDIAIVHGLA